MARRVAGVKVVECITDAALATMTAERDALAAKVKQLEIDLDRAISERDHGFDLGANATRERDAANQALRDFISNVQRPVVSAMQERVELDTAPIIGLAALASVDAAVLHADAIRFQVMGEHGVSFAYDPETMREPGTAYHTLRAALVEAGVLRNLDSNPDAPSTEVAPHRVDDLGEPIF